MVDTIVGTATPSSGSTTSQFWHINGVTDRDSESDVEIRFRTAGVLSKFSCHVWANSINATKTYRIRKNAANGSQSVSVGSSTTGLFQDLVNTDSCDGDDDFCINTTAAGSSGSFEFETYLDFAATTNTVSKFSCDSGASFFSGQDYAASSTTSYNVICGFQDGNRTTTTGEDKIELMMRTAGTLKNLAVEVDSNSRTTTTIVRTRKNSANGAISISIGSGATGLFENTTNTDSLAIGDTINYALVTGSGTADIGINSMSTEFETTNNKGVLLSADTAPRSTDAFETEYIPIRGFQTATSTEASLSSIVTTKLSRDRKFTNMQVNIDANALSGSSTYRFRKNSTNGSLSVSVPGGSTGQFANTTDSDICDAGDLVNYQIIGGSGSGIISSSVSSILTEEIAGALFERSAAGTIQVVTTPTRQKKANRSLNGTAQVATTPTRIKTIRKTLAATAQSSAALTRRKTARPALTATITIVAELARTIIVQRAISASLTISSEVDGRKTFARSLAEELTIESLLERLRTLSRSLSEETVQIDNPLTTLRIVPRSISETIEIAESQIERLLIGIKSFSETITIDDTPIARVHTILRELTATVQSSAALTIQRTIPRPIAETVQILGACAQTFFQSIENSPVTRQLFAFRGVAATAQATAEISSSDIRDRLVNESVIIETAVARLISFARILAATAEVGAVVARLRTVTRSIDEPIEIDSLVNGIKIQLRSIAESVEVASSVARQYLANRLLEVSLVIMDAVENPSFYLRAISESITVDSLVQRTVSFFRDIAASLQLEILLTTRRMFSRTVNELVVIFGTSANIARLRTIPRSLEESLIITVPSVVRLFIARKTNNVFIIVDAQLTKHLSAFKNIAASLEILANLQRTRIVPRTASASLTIVDLVDSIKLVFKELVASFIINDQVVRLRTTPAIILETLTVLTNISTIRSFFRTISEVFTINDAVARIKTISRTINETLILNDQIVRMYTAVKSIPANFSVATATDRTRSAAGAIEIGASFTINSAVAGLRNVRFFERFINETPEVAAALTKQVNYFRTIIQSFSINSLINKVSIFSKSLAISLSLGDSVNRLRIIPRNIASSVEVASNLIFTKIYQILISESLLINSATVRVVLFIGSVAASLQLDAVTERIRLILRQSNESLTAVDQTVRQLIRIVAINEAVSVNSFVQRIKIISRSIGESLILADIINGIRLTEKFVFLFENLVVNSSITHAIIRIGIRVKTAIFDEKSGISFFRGRIRS